MVLAEQGASGRKGEQLKAKTEHAEEKTIQ